MKEYDVIDVIVVGSGPGGATVACELARRGKKVLILEAGPTINEQNLGSFWKTVLFPGYYSKFAAFAMSLQGSTIYHTKNVGGTSVFACGNFVRSLETEFKLRGIDLSEAFKEAEDEIGIAPLDSSKIIMGSKVIMQSARQLGYAMEAMPKGGPYKTACTACGDCVFGCTHGAKWDARVYIDEAIKFGAELRPNTVVKKTLLSNGQAEGVLTSRGIIECNQVVLAAGGLNTPVILQKSGINAGQGLFIDYFNATYGTVDKMSQIRGASMATVDTEYHKQGFILSTYIDHWSQMLLWRPCWYIGHLFPQSRMLGIMTKISDERSGRVYQSGLISKAPTKFDKDKLRAGAEEAAKILGKVGARDITTTKHPRAAHPGGTAAVGEVVDSDLKVKGCKGLYVCDASVFPITPGLPPILTIVALGKWFAKRI